MDRKTRGVRKRIVFTDNPFSLSLFYMNSQDAGRENASLKIYLSSEAFKLLEIYAASHVCSQPATHFTRHAVEVNSSEKKVISAPTRIAPRTLAGAKEMARRITARSTVPRIAARRVGNTVQKHLFLPLPETALVTSKTARYTTAMPNSTHKNAGVTAITAVKFRNAAMMPRIILATPESAMQFSLQLQFRIFISFTSTAKI